MLLARRFFRAWRFASIQAAVISFAAIACGNVLATTPMRRDCDSCASYAPSQVSTIDRHVLASGEAINDLVGGPDGTIWAESYHAVGILAGSSWRTVRVDGGVVFGAASRGRLWFRTAEKRGPLVSIARDGRIDRSSLRSPVRECDVERIALDTRDDPWAAEICFPTHDPTQPAYYVVAYDHDDGRMRMSRLVDRGRFGAAVVDGHRGFVDGGDGVVATSQPLPFGSGFVAKDGASWASSYETIVRLDDRRHEFRFRRMTIMRKPALIEMASDGRSGVILGVNGRVCRITARSRVFCGEGHYGNFIVARDGSFYALDLRDRSLVHFRMDAP